MIRSLLYLAWGVGNPEEIAACELPGCLRAWVRGYFEGLDDTSEKISVVLEKLDDWLSNCDRLNNGLRLATEDESVMVRVIEWDKELGFGCSSSWRTI